MDDETETDEPDLHRARIELFGGLETSRAIVRQSRVLLELSESDGLAAASSYDYDLAG